MLIVKLQLEKPHFHHPKKAILISMIYNVISFCLIDICPHFELYLYLHFCMQSMIFHKNKHFPCLVENAHHTLILPYETGSVVILMCPHRHDEKVGLEVCQLSPWVCFKRIFVTPFWTSKGNLVLPVRNGEKNKSWKFKCSSM